MKTFKIHFIRHGLTKENFEGKYIGSTNVPLCEEGINRLNQLKENYNYPKADIVYSSPLKRCLETAKLFYPDSKILEIPGLAECDFGKWEGRTAEELKNDQDFISWLSGKDTIENMHGETMSDFVKRISDSFEKIVIDIIKNQIENTVIVTHGGVIMTLLSIYGIPKAKSTDWIVGNGCGYSARVTSNLFMRNKVFEVYSKIPEEGQKNSRSETKYIKDSFKNFEN